MCLGSRLCAAVMSLETVSSTSTTTPGVALEYLDPCSAQRDAHIAAEEAYVRARNRTMAEPPLFPLTPRLSSQRHRRQATIRDQNEAQDLRRRQSVRFMGPCSTPAESQGVRRDHSSDELNRACVGDTGNSRERSIQHAGGNGDPNAESSSSLQSVGAPGPLSKTATNYLDALAASEDYYTPEDDVASAPSSYRRLHRTRSMYTDPPRMNSFHEAYQEQSANTSLKSRPASTSMSRRLFRSDPSATKSPRETPVLRAPRSMSFLSTRRSRSQLGSQHRESTLDSGASELADVPEYGSFADESATMRIKRRPSSFFGSLNRHSNFRTRRSLRDSSPSQSVADLNNHPQDTPDQSDTLKFKARRASRSLRIKLRGMFSSTKSDDEPLSIPSQHIESRRTRVAGICPLSSDEGPADGDEKILCNPAAKTPIIHLGMPQTARSNQASLENLSFEQIRNISDGSSLTSWVHSGPSSLTSQEQQQWREWEKQRLSVIGENGAHIPSPSIRRRTLDPGLFNPLRGGPENGESVAGPVVDSQRIYSALVKRMKSLDSRDEQENEGGTQGLDDTPDTIRSVIPERKYAASSTTSTPTRAPRRATLTQNTVDEWGRRSATPLASDKLAHEKVGPDSQLGTTASPASHLFRTESLYRHALGKSMQEEQKAWGQYGSTADEDSDSGTQVHHSVGPHTQTTDSDSAKDLDYSESVYSSDEGDHVSKTRTVVRGPRKQNMTTDTPALYRRQASHREASMVSSAEWKTWLSANVDKFEPTLSPKDPTTFRAMSPATSRRRSLHGHVREQAQIHDDTDWEDEEEAGEGDDVFQSVVVSSSRGARNTTATTAVAAATASTSTTIIPATALAASITTAAAHNGAAPLGRVEPNVVKQPSDGNTRSSHIKNENESPTRPTRPPPPPPNLRSRTPPIPPRSKLRPEPLRILARLAE
ncbi:uncharacterized protein C8A04DRAFT_35545 [Dichotomopilus funicola]|uniref:Uncharacterized protein n=1 Tax=Dichotomopilus funicola TaxID=1934379 RepID=A0AAN6ZP69_9PEZI|nr:hypothetical protein C8A04DRAFT_35545 [Dichotomopilus funicola]